MPQETHLTFPCDGGVNTTAVGGDVQPPELADSSNTRLTLRRNTITAAPTPGLLHGLPTNTECAGIVPAGHVDSAIAFVSPIGGGMRRIVDDLSAPFMSTLDTSTAPSAFVPAELVRGRAIPGAVDQRPNAVCIHDGLRVFASIRPYHALDTMGVGLYVTVLDDAGAVIIPPTFAGEIGTETAPPTIEVSSWVGLTSHGSTYGVRLWYVRGTSIYRRTLTIVGLALTVGAEVLHSTTGSWALPATIDVVAGSGFDAYLVHFEDDSSFLYVLDKVNINANTYARTALPTTGGAIAVSYRQGSSFGYVVLSYVGGVVTHYLRAYRSDTMASVWSFNEAGGPNVGSAVQFLRQGGTDYVVIVKGGNAGNLVFQIRLRATGVLVCAREMFGLRLVDRGATITLDSDNYAPVFTLQRSSIFPNDLDSSDVHYVPDPSLELYLVRLATPTTMHVTPVARFGVDRVRSTQFYGRSPTIVSLGRRVVVTYMAQQYEPTGNTSGKLGRYVEVDFTPRQPRYALDAAGVAIVAGALPVIWDGAELVEAGPLHRPIITVTKVETEDEELELPEGDYYWRAIYTWRDAAGQLHRSAPSLPYGPLSALGGEHVTAVLSIMPSDSMRNGLTQEIVDTTIYQTVVNGSEFWSRTDYRTTQTIGEVTVVNSVISSDPPVDTTLIYTTEGTTPDGSPEELAAEGPPPMWDVAVIGLRAMAIHAEQRSRLCMTKRRVDGFGLEWSQYLFIDFPPAAGDLIAVSELDGKPLVFSEGGVYVIDGEGPDNTGQGAYGEPRRLADVVCSNRDSVVRYPGGVFFLADSRLCILGAGGGGLRVVDQIDASVLGTISAAFVDPRAHELVYLVAADDGNKPALVYNYVLDRFTFWPSLARLGIGALTSPTRVSCFDPTGPALRTVDLAGDEGASAVALRWGWVMPAGPEGNLVARELIVQGLEGETPYTLQVLAHLDYDDSEPVLDVTYSAAELAEATNGGGRYTLRQALEHCIGRSLRFELIATATELPASREFFTPLAVTLTLGVSPTELRRHVTAGMK